MRPTRGFLEPPKSHHYTVSHHLLLFLLKVGSTLFQFQSLLIVEIFGISNQFLRLRLLTSARCQPYTSAPFYQCSQCTGITSIQLLSQLSGRPRLSLYFSRTFPLNGRRPDLGRCFHSEPSRCFYIREPRCIAMSSLHRSTLVAILYQEDLLYHDQHFPLLLYHEELRHMINLALLYIDQLFLRDHCQTIYHGPLNPSSDFKNPRRIQ